MWRLPIILLGPMPVHVWLGIFLALLVLLQMSIAKKIIPLNFDIWHRRIVPVLILIVLFFSCLVGTFNLLATLSITLY